MKKFVKLILHAILSPLPVPRHPQYSQDGLNLGWRYGWIRGILARPAWKLSELRGGPRVRVGRRFCLYGNIRFSGPGSLILGDDVIVGGDCTPFTHGSDAVLKIGSRTFLNGTRFGCSKSIEVGDDCILADARIMDTDFHAVHKQRNLAQMSPDTAPVKIGNNVWVAAGAAILKGVEIGDNSVVAFGSVVAKSIPSDKIFGGNPAKELGTVPEGPRQ